MRMERLNCYYGAASSGEGKGGREGEHRVEGAGLEPVITGQGGRKRRKVMEMSVVGRVGGEDGAG